ncbi:hypothetical protein [Dyadobacter sp. CY312]|uniref:hypothetical protein n=1 Tax=Dyadobacter sp. CY312 TaxID=2907303 RepID=UPI001F2F9E9E|nr:hypothetical protein [Dyadobacter sp. CY312]MCE7043306.1 hypothetical protein [Dyadobacter sp. CY312]
MHITRELIEKYHAGNCTPDEIKAVEDWLFSDEAEEQFMLPDGEIKGKIQDEIWNEINPATPVSRSNYTFFNSPHFWRPAVAAAAVLVLGTTLFNIKYPAFNNEVIVLKNASETINKDVNESRYTISLGPKSNIEINNNTGSIDFCGAVMINPKEDIEFTIQGTCSNPNEQKETMTLRKGLNYIALNYSSHENDSEMIILEEGSLMGLPPLVQRQLMSQFNI